MALERRYYKNILSLAIPVVTANIGQGVISIIDTIMVGRLGATELAAASFAGVLILNVIVFGMGIAISLTPIVGKHYAMGNYRKASSYLQNSLSLNGIIGLIIMIGLIACMPLLDHMNQPQDVVDTCKPFFFLLSISTLPYMLFLSFKQFLEGLGNTKVSMYITISANLINILLNYMLIYGKLGAPAMGITGAAVATLVSRVLMLLFFVVYIYRSRIYSRYLSFFSFEQLRLRRHKALLKVGLPISGQMVVEMMALSMTAIMMGWISTEALAANQIVLSVISLMFMVASGIAGAVTIMVSHEVGRKNRREIIGNTVAGLHISTLVMICASLIYVVFGDYIAMIFTTDPKVIELAGKIFVVAALFEIIDGLQVTALGALRGMTDVTRPMLYAIFAYAFINIPLAYLLGFTFEMGVSGIWLGFFVGLSIAAILFIKRFYNRVKIIRF